MFRLERRRPEGPRACFQGKKFGQKTVKRKSRMAETAFYSDLVRIAWTCNKLTSTILPASPSTKPPGTGAVHPVKGHKTGKGPLPLAL